MAFPTVESANPTSDSSTGGAATNGSTAATSHAVVMPATVSARSLLVVLGRVAAAGTVSATGWTVIQDSSDASDDVTFIAYQTARAVGNEDGTSVTFSHGSGKMAAVSLSIAGAEGHALETSTVAVGTTTTINPTTCTPTGGAKDYLWIWFGASDGEATLSKTAATNYTSNDVDVSTGTGGATTTNVQIKVGTRTNNAASEDPGSVTWSAAPAGWTAYTIGVHPGVSQTKSLTAATSTEVAGSIVAWTISPASETDAAQVLDFDVSGPKTLTPATEADAAQALSFTKTIFKSLTAVTETDAAQALDKDKHVLLGRNTIKRLTLTGWNGGTFDLMFNGSGHSAPIAYNASAATVQSALEGLANIDPGDVICTDVTLTGDETLKVDIEFTGQWKRMTVGSLVITVTNIDLTTADTGGWSVGNQQAGSNTYTSESDAAQTLSVSQASNYSLTAATETDAAQALSFTKTIYKNLIAATETGAAQVLSVTKTIFKSLTPATEPDAAQASDAAKTLAVTSATETDAAQAVSFDQPQGPITLTPATSIEVAGSIVAWQISSATETDAAQALSITAGSYTLTPVTETDVVAGLEALRITAATEADAAQALTIAAGEYSLTPATEADAAQALSFIKTIYKSLTAAVSTDAAQGLSLYRTRTLSPASEDDAAQALSVAKTIPLVAAVEADAAQDLVTQANLVLTPATEADSGQLLSKLKIVVLSPATESDDAVPFSGFQPEGGTGRQRMLTGVGG